MNPDVGFESIWEKRNILLAFSVKRSLFILYWYLSFKSGNLIYFSYRGVNSRDDDDNFKFSVGGVSPLTLSSQ